MASLKIVRCEVRPAGGSQAGSPRYVPLEIFGLWEFLMAERHHFEVVRPCASLWLDTDDTPVAAYGEAQYERVTEVKAFVYSPRDDRFAPVCRYFPTESCAELKQLFLSHYVPGRPAQAHVREREGIWIRRETVQVG